ncbi:hypothetical protein FHS17_004709 [Paenibacillus lupini]|nr:hypothetical protein [Paenibacillus lupini]
MVGQKQQADVQLSGKQAGNLGVHAALIAKSQQRTCQ